ncbi:hypothetical protein PHLGIDRAFT_97395 [Phlebiopsis gigantea 11061_1 CR5-6]|uniref:Peroxisomal membrane protein PEX14 n=1 Tax=Phlebiopsis gigantea (strain 11061_1 CR5-6) TaxID=745531 RepID=A0A0C3P454_PHLG1|nr:hypothetical protein PHLGIDRAFT_97395 [Phlebiopsis gigantea 11061_1 CR5-6]
MSDSHSSSTPSTSQTATGEQPQEPQSQSAGDGQGAPVPAAEDRSELLQRARAFLTSPQVLHEDLTAKRRFLLEKGLNDAEVESLLRDMPQPAPAIPPRTYPQPPPSSLPNLLVGVLRIATWFAGGSAAILLLYFRFIYPRIAQTFHARHSIQSHQKTLLGRLTESLEALKASQAETFAALPRPEAYTIPPSYRHCQSLDDVVNAAGDARDIPHIPLLRYAAAELSSQKAKPTAEAIFQLLESKLPWIQTEEDAKFENELWETLSTSPLFSQTEADGTVLWSFTPPPEQPSPPLLSSLATLRDTLPGPQPPSTSLQGTQEALSDLTGYVSAQTYTMPSYRFTAPGLSTTLTPEEEEVRREIRALKGLVLNRRSFLPPRPATAPAAGSASVPS